MNPTGTTYTNPLGLTPQANSLSTLSNALNQIQGLPQNSPVGTSQAQAQQFSNAEPQAVQQASNQMQQSSGITALQGQQQNLGQVFGMWLADQNLASKYASPQLTSGGDQVWNSGLQNNPQQIAGLGITDQGIQDPYLASPSSIINAIAGGGFQGATTPSQNTQEIGVVPSSAQNIMSSIGNLISSQQGLVNTQLGNYETAYGDEANLLNNLAQIEASRAQTQETSGPGGYAPGSSQSAGYMFNTILDTLGPNATADDVWNYLNTHQTSLTAQVGSSIMGQLWQMQKQLANQVGGAGLTGSGKVPTAKAKKAAKASVGPMGSTYSTGTGTAKKTYKWNSTTNKYVDVTDLGQSNDNNPLSISNIVQDVMNPLGSLFEGGSSSSGGQWQ